MTHPQTEHLRGGSEGEVYKNFYDKQIKHIALSKTTPTLVKSQLFFLMYYDTVTSTAKLVNSTLSTDHVQAH